MCHDCGKQFVGGDRPDCESIITDYIDGKLTLRQLSQKYSLSVRTVWDRLKGMRHVHVISKHKDVVINIHHLLGQAFRPYDNQGCVSQ